MIRLVFSKLFKNLVIEFLLEQLYVNFLKIHIVSHDIRIKKTNKKKRRGHLVQPHHAGHNFDL